jgi:hypothetical protein
MIHKTGLCCSLLEGHYLTLRPFFFSADFFFFSNQFVPDFRSILRIFFAPRLLLPVIFRIRHPVPGFLASVLNTLPITNTLSHNGQQFGMRDGVEVLGQIRVDDLAMPPQQTLCHGIGCIMG